MWLTARALPVAYLLLALGSLLAAPGARADRSPEKPTAPKNIDQTPPLVPILNARVSEEGLLVGDNRRSINSVRFKKRATAWWFLSAPVARRDMKASGPRWNVSG